MTQYCRYCTAFVTGNGNWCDVKQFSPTDKQAKSPNKCKMFKLNPIDAYFENEKGYRPRTKSTSEQSEQLRIDF